MSDLFKQIQEFTEYFSARSSEFFGQDGSYLQNKFKVPNWQESEQALLTRIRDSQHIDAFVTIGSHQTLYIPPILDFLAQHQITHLSYYEPGSSAETFEAKVKTSSSQRFVVRIGPESKIEKSSPTTAVYLPSDITIINRPWNPLTLQPSEKMTLIHKNEGFYDRGRTMIEVLPLLPILPRDQPKNFPTFINKYILRNTPFRVEENKDLALMSNGTPVFVDPGSLNFSNDALARKHAIDQFNGRWQQEIMSTIAQNCMTIGLSAPFNWVLNKNGKFITQQNALYSPGKSPVRKRVVRLRHKTEFAPK